MLDAFERCALWSSWTYVWKTAISTPRDLGFVSVDEDARVAVRTAASVAHDDTIVGPLDWLLVDKLHSGEGCRLENDKLWSAKAS